MPLAASDMLVRERREKGVYQRRNKRWWERKRGENINTFLWKDTRMGTAAP
jgi:hypothetical protein